MFWKIVIGAALVAGAFFTVRSLSGAREPQRTRTTYYYYPKANLYFDSTAAKYLLYDSGSAEWKEQPRLPVNMEIGKGVRIDSPSSPVWKQNAEHRTIYSVALYGSPQDLKEKKKPKPVTRKQPSNTDSAQQPKKKSGLGRFFEKIFKGKKPDG